MVKVAVAQIEIFEELNKNIKKVLKFIDKASSKKADIVCFPESCLGDKEIDLKSREIKAIQDKCKKKAVSCIVGAHIKEGRKIFNSAILIDGLGKIIYVYKKVNLFHGLDLEKSSAGKTNKVIQTSF